MALFGEIVLDISHFGARFADSSHVQLGTYRVSQVESESGVRSDQFIYPEEETQKHRPTIEFLSKKHVKFDQGLDFLIFCQGNRGRS